MCVGGGGGVWVQSIILSVHIEHDQWNSGLAAG